MEHRGVLTVVDTGTDVATSAAAAAATAAALRLQCLVFCLRLGLHQCLRCVATAVSVRVELSLGW